MTLSPGTPVGPYEILGLLGTGGMGEVYQARDTRLGRLVALKFLSDDVAKHPTRRLRFETEARAISSLSHPHICALFDVGEQNPLTSSGQALSTLREPQGRPEPGRGPTGPGQAPSTGSGQAVVYLVMEYVEGETLDDRLTRGPLPASDVLHLATQIADALDHAHRQGVIHRDLKPSNVMLTRSGAKLLDFGLARLQVAEAVSPGSTLSLEPHKLTAEGTILGTFQYMAPEQLEGKETDARTDIFAFGTLVYEMATGRRPFEGKSQASLIARFSSVSRPPRRVISRRFRSRSIMSSAAVSPRILMNDGNRRAI